MPKPQGVDDVFTIAALDELGITRRKRAALVKSGRLVRVRNGWFAHPDADIDRVRAVRLGGRVTCHSALRSLGLWVMPDSRLHVAVAHNASRLRCPDDRERSWDPASHPEIRVHWTADAPPIPTSADSVTASIAHLLRCVSRNSAVVTIDSALNTVAAGRPVLSMTELRDAIALLPDSHARILELVDPGAQSGLETLARLNLRARGIRVRTQVPIDRVGRVDVLVGDRLVIELDGRRHHLGENYEVDRSRDLELFRQGFAQIRVSYRAVMYDWASVEAAILMAVRRGDHLRRARDARLGLIGVPAL